MQRETGNKFSVIGEPAGACGIQSEEVIILAEF